MIPAPVGYQCPECVADARKAFREGPGRRDRVATVKRTSVTTGMVLLLVGVFIAQIVSGGSLSIGLNGEVDPLLVRGADVPILVANGEYYRLFTAMFLHIGLLHLLTNIWALWIFGQYVEGSFGRGGFLAIYLIGGFLGSVASYLFGNPLVPSAGASGAIFALFGAFIAYNVRRRENAMSRANLQSAVLIVILNLVLTLGYSRIDWRAHLGGLVAGMAIGALLDWGSLRASRRALALAGVAGVAVVGVVLVMVRTSQLKSILPNLLGFLF
jgi:membrane associated rhomboid family serine protease